MKFFRAVAAAAIPLHLAAPAVIARAQGFQGRWDSAAEYQVSTLYDRVTDSTRVVITSTRSSRPFGFGSRVWLEVSFTHAGRRLTVPPEAVVLTLESFTPARGGWAFAGPRKLSIASPGALALELPAAEYEKLPVRLLDSGRREMLSFRIPTGRFTAIAAEPELELKAGNARMRLRERQMRILRDIVRRWTPAPSEVR